MQGPILVSEGEAFKYEITNGGSDLGDHVFPCAERGLRVFDGEVKTTAGPDSNVYFKGAWRLLTLPEMNALRLRLRFRIFPS